MALLKTIRIERNDPRETFETLLEVLEIAQEHWKDITIIEFNVEPESAKVLKMDDKEE